MLRRFRRSRSNPSGCAGSEEADPVRVDLGRATERGDCADRVRCDEVEVTVSIWTTLPLRLAHPALVVREERDPVSDVAGDQRAVGESWLLAAPMQPDHRRVPTMLQRQIQRSGEAGTGASEMDS